MSSAVVLFKMPRLLEDIVHDLISSEPELRLAGSVAEENGLLELLELDGVDIVVEGSETDRLGDFETELLYRRPALRVVQVALDGRTAAVWRLRPDRTLLSEVSSTGLIGAIRAAAPASTELREAPNG